MWGRKALHLGHYFARIGHFEVSMELYNKAKVLGQEPPLINTLA